MRRQQVAFRMLRIHRRAWATFVVLDRPGGTCVSRLSFRLLGGEQSKLAQRAGIRPETAVRIGRIAAGIVDKLTPNGEIQQGGDHSMAWLLKASCEGQSVPSRRLSMRYTA
jgi:hypothetical protein